MKSLFNAAIGRLSLGVILLLTIGTASAQTGASDSAMSADPAVVRYLGVQDDMLIFNVSYNNPQGGKFLVQVLDQDGNQLFQDIFRDKAFYRQFRLPKVDKDQITFVIRKGQDAPVEKRFAVNISSRLVQEVAIKKL
jgi:hypothetical protein